MKITFMLMIILISSCGNSPLLNHDNEKNHVGDNSVVSESNIHKFKKSGYSFVISWVEGPRMGESRFILKSWHNDHGTLNGPYQDLPKQLHVMLWMPGMGHGSSPVTLQKIDQGEYEVSSVQFIMGGTWEIKFQLKDGAQVADETVLTLSI